MLARLSGLSGLAFSSRALTHSIQPASHVVQITGRRFGHELAPRYTIQKKKQKGRVTVRTGESEKGNTLTFGDYGMRLKSQGLRIKADQLQAADTILLKFVKAGNGKLWRRLCTNIAVCVKGNTTRMGKGKGPFDHWAARVPTGKVVFEIANMHEQEAKDALRRACDKLPGVWEFIRTNTPIRVGLKTFKENKPAEKKNYLDLLKKSPSKQYANFLKSRQPEFRKYNGRR
ncbi:hypothetical protein HII12_003899 [Brettanomyces bruxellensis]|uniref:Ribosomal protein L10e/L16 domain-containing protein n=1 Tax=Dekkera bruxellensis TaxID=5007 RepID=A0A8H6BBR7_DEKBR|nr:hypothetical protein HII12_003899 [Brettanomyces bruxellensis]